MHPLVSTVTVACIPVPVPVVMETLLIVPAIGCRAKPGIIMQGYRRFTVLRDAKGIMWFEAEASCHIYITNTSVMQEFYCVYDILVRASLKSNLDTNVVPAGRLNHLPAFKYIVTAWLLHIHMFTCLSFEPIMEPYDCAVNPMPPMAMPADPRTLCLIKSLRFVILFLFESEY
jgi:hypothetical protein